MVAAAGQVGHAAHHRIGPARRGLVLEVGRRYDCSAVLRAPPAGGTSAAAVGVAVLGGGTLSFAPLMPVAPDMHAVGGLRYAGAGG